MALVNRSERWRRTSTLAVASLMTAAVLALYSPWIYLRHDQQLAGSDFILLHQRRIQYARQFLLASPHSLPGWYSREALGTPFWANLQNFPWIPTRLLLLPLDPGRAYVIGVNLAAVLAAWFTFGFCRQIGLSRLACAASGWTFAAAGFFASRVLEGHLPLLEAYPALPLLLLLIEKCLQRSPPSAAALLTLTFSMTAICLAGHPQLPLYALITASLYALLRNRGREAAWIFCSMALGAGIAAFALWPFLRLIARSTRILNLNPADNDIAFPVNRLLAFILPWRDGWPEMIHRLPHIPLAYSNEFVFWDTVCYLGWLPLLAAIALLARWIILRKLPDKRFIFFAAIGILALALACDPVHFGSPISHLTLLRSPARLIYVTTFCLCIGLGAAIDAILKLAAKRKSKLIRMAVVLALAAHAIDLGSHDLNFITPIPYQPPDPAALSNAQQIVGDQRVAIDWDLGLPLNRQLDDVGFFDSLILAKPYAALLDLARLPPETNLEYFDGSSLDARAQIACGVKVIVTPAPDGTIQTEILSHPAPRAAFYSPDACLFLDDTEIHAKLRDPQFDLQRWLLLPPARPAPSTSPAQAQLAYHRDSSDIITVDLTTAAPGFLRILEAWDPGWSATIDSNPAAPIPADGVFLALPIPPGSHRIIFRYSTPGAATGAAISLASLILLVILLALKKKPL
jgi:hypothetical protein